MGSFFISREGITKLFEGGNFCIDEFFVSFNFEFAGNIFEIFDNVINVAFVHISIELINRGKGGYNILVDFGGVIEGLIDGVALIGDFFDSFAELLVSFYSLSGANFVEKSVSNIFKLLDVAGGFLAIGCGVAIVREDTVA